MLLILIEIGKERERKERNTNVREKPRLTLSCMCPDWDQTCNLGMGPDQKLNPPTFGVWDNAPTTQATRPG